MELRNIRRFYSTPKGLRIWRKKNSGKVVSSAGLNYLACLYFHPSFYTASYIRALVRKDGYTPASVSAVFVVLRSLVASGFVDRDNAGRYGLSPAGKSALFEIEKCIRDARPDR